MGKEMKQVSESVGAYYQHYPRIAAVVSAYHDGKADAMTCTWHVPLSSRPPLFGVSSDAQPFHVPD